MTEQGSPAPEISPELMAAVQAAMAQQSAEPPAPNGYRLGGPAPAPNVIDLDAQLARIDTAPQPIRLGGYTYMVRRDFTTAEANALVKLAQTADDNPESEIEFWAALVGLEDARRLQAFTESLPMAKAQTIGAQFGAAAGLGEALRGPLGEA